MKLKELLQGVPVSVLTATDDPDILGLAYSSKAVRPGYLFAALKGEKADGQDFIAEAVGNGAAAVLSEWPKPGPAETAWIQVPDGREALALAAANFYGQPSLRLKIVGVTGTKGKTTVTYLLESIVRASGGRPGVVGTIEYRTPSRRTKAPHTTPEAPDLQRMLAEMLDEGATHGLLEISSHALEQKRVWGVGFDVAVFTNLSGEHLDYHRSMDAYFEAKKKLFFLNHKRSASVVNLDDEWGRRLIQELPMRTISFGLDAAAIVRAESYDSSERGLDIRLTYPGGRLRIASRLIGRHNVSNILAAAAAALALNIAPEAIAAGIAGLAGVPGRFEEVPVPLGFRVFVDYAHTDSALVNVLQAARDLKPRRILLVFGAGGNRDHAKRARMGAAAARLADWTILTADNPRSEDPAAIIADIETGFRAQGAANFEAEPDRREAIRRALTMARRGDFVIVAGKGHEDYQVFKDRTVPFSDVAVVAELAAGMKEP